MNACPPDELGASPSPDLRTRRIFACACRRRWRLALLFGLATLPVVCFVCPLCWDATRLADAVDSPGDTRFKGPFSATYVRRLAGESLPTPPSDPARVRRELLANSYDPACWIHVRFADGTQFLSWHTDEWGTPFRAFHAWQAIDWQTGRQIAHGGGFHPHLGLDDPNPRFAPMTPIWPGVVGNVVVYTAGWLAVLVAPSVLRQRRRIKAGRCPACRYDLLGEFSTGCPECGWARAPSAPPPGRGG